MERQREQQPKKNECINKRASKAPLRANVPEVPAAAAGGGRRVQTVSFQLQCSIWQHTQSHKQRPQNNGWTDRMSAYITTGWEVVESKQTHAQFYSPFVRRGDDANVIQIMNIKLQVRWDRLSRTKLHSFETLNIFYPFIWPFRWCLQRSQMCVLVCACRN